jgi:uncharacterized protein YcbK (DUF882 family)
VSNNDRLHSQTTRRAFIAGGFSFTAAAAVAPVSALAKSSDSLRRINIYSPRTDERLDAIYYVKGQYVPDVMAQLNNILRDVRADEVRKIDPQLIDILAAAQSLLGHDRPFSVISGYRSKKTNDLLRRKGRGVAKNSYHTKGMAADLRMEGVDVAMLQKAGRQIGAGGIGIYTKSNFVHLDSGPVRTWGR